MKFFFVLLLFWLGRIPRELLLQGCLVRLEAAQAFAPRPEEYRTSNGELKADDRKTVMPKIHSLPSILMALYSLQMA
jgi:hypothetical protein